MLFGQASSLYTLWIVIVLIYIFILDEKIRRRLLSRWGSDQTIDLLCRNVNSRKRIVKKILEVLAFTLLIIALARPLLGKSQEEIKQKGLDIVIAVDTSKSMMAEDFSPSRLSKAKQELIGLLNELQGNRIGLIAFSGTALTLCPLTLDTQSLKVYIDILDTEIIGIQGTDLGDAIKEGLKLFEIGKRYGKLIILITDGEDHETKAIKAAQKAKDKGVRIFAIGIGKKEGEPIPLLDDQGNRIGHKKSQNNDVVLTKLNSEILKEITELTGGQYYEATMGEIEINKIYNDIKSYEKGEFKEKVVIRYEERYQISLLLALLLFIFSEFISERKNLNKYVKR